VARVAAGTSRTGRLTLRVGAKARRGTYRVPVRVTVGNRTVEEALRITVR
jgi:uncharacterized membrane protein